jgi:hypothetical protein
MLEKIVRAAIHPGIGVARLGNSEEPDGYYIGPEVVKPPLTPPGGTRDRRGAILRQAARFRIYGYDAGGQVVAELTADNAEIDWQAHLVNRKGQWYQFQAALDIPASATMKVPLRNAKVTGAARAGLAIDPGPRSIRGKSTCGAAYHFDSGKFQDTTVPLGELRTDPAGRLLVLGGHGVSASPTNQPIYDKNNPDSFNNADGWYDDTSDGPVHATVKIGGSEVPVDSAWVFVGPPNFAPDIVAWRTLYDLLVDTYVAAGWLSYPAQVSFRRDVLPVLDRLSNLQWVNAGFAALFGAGGQFDFSDPTLLRKLSAKPLADGSDPFAELRQVVYNAFRPSNNQVNDPRTWPWIYGDAFGVSDTSPENNLALSAVRDQVLQKWVKGEFVDDLAPLGLPPREIEEVPLALQPAMLDQAALHFCLADAFHPGCELTWPMRHSSLYRAPFRIKERPAGTPEPDYGPVLTPEIALAEDGPLYAQGPGDLSRWMALPWQGDTAYCRSGYDVDYDPYLPTFWPARVPNQVLDQADYAIVMDESRPLGERIAAFHRRVSWLRKLSGPVAVQMKQMVAGFGAMGIVEAHHGPGGSLDLPRLIFVETLPPASPPHAEVLAAAAEVAAKAAAPGPADERTERLRRAGWNSEQELSEALDMMHGRGED